MSEAGETRRSKFKVSWKGWLALLATLGVIALVVFPMYGDYAHRAQNAEAISLLVGAKTPLSEYFQNQGKWPENLDNIVESASGRFTKSVAITKGAGGDGEIVLTATMGTEGVDRRVRGKTILWVSSDGGKNWTCKPGTMPEEHLPQYCRTK
jgi:type IV pilus assembly protein PilA